VTTASRRERDRGQAALEIALSLPIVAVLLLGVVQVAIVVRNEIALELAAREGARAAAVAEDRSGAARRAVERAVALPTRVAVSTTGSDVTVTVTYTDPTDVPLIGWAIGPVASAATATMALEPP
jgi:uncharacterized protein (UPF0333 family)